MFKRLEPSVFSSLEPQPSDKVGALSLEPSRSVKASSLSLLSLNGCPPPIEKPQQRSFEFLGCSDRDSMKFPTLLGGKTEGSKGLTEGSYRRALGLSLLRFLKPLASSLGGSSRG